MEKKEARQIANLWNEKFQGAKKRQRQKLSFVKS